MKNILYVALIFAAGTTTATAQWLKHPTPGIPRTADGKPNLSAPAPRTADGKPDLSGIWQVNALGYAINILSDQKSEMLPWAEALYRERVATYGKDSPNTNCLPSGPRAGHFPLDLFKIVQTPGLVLILYELTRTRQIFTDGRDLPIDPDPTWMGYSVGRWNGDTLVVDTAGYNDRTWLDLTGHPHTEALHMTERYRRKDFGHIELQVTFQDPKAYTNPWTIAMDVNYVPDTELLEYVCNENENDRAHLVGTLNDEVKRETKVAAAILAQYVGVYSTGPLGNLRVSLDGDRLAIEVPLAGIHPMFAQSESEFAVPTLGGIVGVVQFVAGANGTITHLVMKAIEGDRRAVRVSDPVESERR